METTAVTFAPELFIPAGVRDIDFYIHAFGAVVVRQFLNENGTIHVAELSIGGALFHVHEEKRAAGKMSPDKAGGTTVTLGLFVPDVDAVMQAAIAAGAEIRIPAQDYDYGYRQGEVRDPWGHIWMIESKL